MNLQTYDIISVLYMICVCSYKVIHFCSYGVILGRDFFICNLFFGILYVSKEFVTSIPLVTGGKLLLLRDYRDIYCM
jgi:hypothetical protein